MTTSKPAPSATATAFSEAATKYRERAAALRKHAQSPPSTPYSTDDSNRLYAADCNSKANQAEQDAAFLERLSSLLDLSALPPLP